MGEVRGARFAVRLAWMMTYMSVSIEPSESMDAQVSYSHFF